MEEKAEAKKQKVDKRLIYILPSILALVFAITCFGYQFGNQIVDLNNTCYTVYVSIPEEYSDEEALEKINSTLANEDISGFTVLKNTQGGHIDENKNLVLDNSYQIILMNLPKKDAYKIANDLKDAFGSPSAVIAESIVKFSYL